MSFVVRAVVGTTAISARCERLTRKQLKLVQRYEDLWSRAEQVCRWACSVDPTDWPMGVTLALSEAIVSRSILEDPSQIYIDEIERSNTDAEWVRNVLICVAFPQYTFEMLDQLSWEDWVRLTARADWKLLNFHGITEKDLSALLEPQRAAAAAKREQFDSQLKMMEAIAGGPAPTAADSLFARVDPSILAEMKEAESGLSLSLAQGRNGTANTS